MDNTHSTLSSAKERIADLERQLAAAVASVQVYELRIANLKSTWSWKLTAPFREIARAISRLIGGGQNLSLKSWIDPKAWKRFFREAERRFRMARRKVWQRKEKPMPSVKPTSARAMKIHAELETAVARQRKAA